jgi:hypothetical protein
VIAGRTGRDGDVRVADVAGLGVGAVEAELTETTGDALVTGADAEGEADVRLPAVADDVQAAADSTTTVPTKTTHTAAPRTRGAWCREVVIAWGQGAGGPWPDGS